MGNAAAPSNPGEHLSGSSGGSIKRLYDEYWADPTTASPVRDPDTPGRISYLRRVLGARTGLQVLDIGCGHGETLSALISWGHRASGLDIAENAVAEAQRRNPGASLICHAVEDTPWPLGGGEFDAVVSFEVLEHLVFPKTLPAEAFRVLKPGGLLLISTPYHGFSKTVALAAHGFERHFNVNGPHIRFFTERALRDLFTESGFVSLKLTRYGRIPPLARGSFVLGTRP
jgi:2-polyprenyl-3-methyl-5-hydroxy-6-metoxy-1,4-benzoquinol methylase